MPWNRRAIVATLGVFAIGALGLAAAHGWRAEIKAAVKSFLESNSRTAPMAGAIDAGAAIKSSAALLFDSPRQVTLGNRNGDVTLVEFFDYNCPFCRRAAADAVAVLNDDPKLRLVLKELPILGPGSSEAARVAVALHLQDASGDKYLAFHQKLLSGRGPANQASAMVVAASVGADMERLESDLANPNIAATIDENIKLARAIGIRGTPAYVIGRMVIPGAIGVVALKELIRAERR